MGEYDIMDILNMQFKDNNLVFKVDCETSYDDVFYLQYAKMEQNKWFTLKISTKPAFSYEVHAGLNIGDQFRCVGIRNAEIRFTTEPVRISTIPHSVEINEFIPDTFQSILAQCEIESFELIIKAYFINNQVAFKVEPSIPGNYTYTLQYYPKNANKWYNVCDFTESLYRYQLPYITQIGDLYRCVIKEEEKIICKSNEVQIFKEYEPDIGLESKRSENKIIFNLLGSDITGCLLQFRRGGNSSWTDVGPVMSSTFSYSLSPETRVGDAYRCAIKDNNRIIKITNEIHINAPYYTKE